MDDKDTGRIHGALGRIEGKLEEHDKRFDGLDKRLEAGEADGDGLRSAMQKLRSSIEALPCERHTEKMRDHDRRISGLVKSVTESDTTGKIEVAKLEAAAAVKKAAENADVSRKDKAWRRAVQLAAIAGSLGIGSVLGWMLSR